MTLRQERDEVLHAIVAFIAGGEGSKSDTPWMREMELESMQKRAAELHEQYLALHYGMKELEDKLENHKREFDKVLEEGRTQPPISSDDASTSATPGLDIQELASALSSSGPKSSATQIQQSLKDYDEVNKVHRIGVLAEFRLNGDSVTIICHRRIEIKGLSPVSPNIIMVNVKHHDEVGPNISTAATSASSTSSASSTPASSSAASSTPTSPASPYSSEVTAYVSLIHDATTQLLSHEEIKKRSKSFTTPFIDPSIPGHLCDYVTSLIVSDADVLQDILSTVDLKDRCYKVLQLTKNEQRTMAARKRIQEKVVVDPAYSKEWLREQKRNIERQLGGKDNRQATVDKFLARLEGKVVPPDVLRVINEEVDKLCGSDNEGSEYSITRNYVDWLTSMPYSVYTTERRNIDEAEKILNEDHYGMEDVKQRILEFIAATTRAGKEAQQGKIICLTGPPGVGSDRSHLTHALSPLHRTLCTHCLLAVFSGGLVLQEDVHRPEHREGVGPRVQPLQCRRHG
jgi:ATP-dependent Lon protease